MILLSAQNITKIYVERKILDNVSFFLNEGDKIGIIGVNGTGKSTLLKILAGREHYDSGEITKTGGVRIGYLPQTPVFDSHATIIEHVFAGLSEAERDAKQYEAKAILTKLGITDFERDITTMSGGEKRRVAIAAALVKPCEVLIMDEPTNHIDNETVTWLEELLQKYKGAIVMVTHDRYFLDRVSNKIVEVDRGKLYSYDGNFSTFVKLKAEREEMALNTERKNKSLYRRELEWIRQGPCARGTKSKERIARFEALENREKPVQESKLELNSVSSRLGKKIIEIHNISKSFEGKPLIKDFGINIQRDARIGIVGRNGCGKSTFLKLMVGKIKPDSGEVVIGDTVKIGYFSQESDDMPLDIRAIDYVKQSSNRIETVDGVLTASQLMEKFLFTGEQQYNLVGKLSGGERKRLYLLKILITAPNVLLLDEPTNDLDITTLEILEDYIDNFKGAVIAVSHDRYFLDKIADSIWEFTGNGEVNRYLGGYTDYLEKRPAPVEISRQKDEKPKAKNKSARLKFSYNEQREFDSIDSEIEQLENEISRIDEEIGNSSSDFEKLQRLMEEKQTAEEKLEQKMDRWVYLNDLAEQIKNQ